MPSSEKKSEAELALEAIDAPELVKARVARGTVVWGDRQHTTVGGEVELPADDVARLRDAGMLLPENGLPLVASGVGPVYNRENGVAVS